MISPIHQRKINRESRDCAKEDIEDLVLPDSDRCIYSIEKIDTEPLAVKNARLFMKEPKTNSKIDCISSQFIPIPSTSLERVRSSISPGLQKLEKGKKKKTKYSTPIKRFSSKSTGILKGSNQNRSSRSGSQKKVSFNIDCSKYGDCQAFGLVQMRKKYTIIQMLRQF